MKSSDAIAWFEELERFVPTSSLPASAEPPVRWAAQRISIIAWATNVGAAIDAVFPPGHSVRTDWRAFTSGADWAALPSENSAELGLRLLVKARGIVRGAYDIVRSRRLMSLLDGVRAETVGELLDQSAELNCGGASVPAAVLAGGALETHLRHLCDRNGLLASMQGHGAIEKYRGLLDQARNAGNEIISMGDSKQLTAWADDRNTAAHNPTKFTKDAAAVQLMIDGIRQFIARTK